MAYYGYGNPLPNNPVAGGEPPGRAGFQQPTNWGVAPSNPTPGAAYIPPGNPYNPYGARRGTPPISDADQWWNSIRGGGGISMAGVPDWVRQSNPGWQNMWSAYYRPQPTVTPNIDTPPNIPYTPPFLRPGYQTPDVGGEQYPPPIGGGGLPPGSDSGGLPPITGGGGYLPPIGGGNTGGIGGYNPDPRDTIKLPKYGGYQVDPRRKFAPYVPTPNLSGGSPYGGQPQGNQQYGINKFRQGGWF